MTFINDSLKKEIDPILAKLSKNVKLVYFTQKTECRFCSETRELLTELSGLSPMINLEVLDFQADRMRAKELGIDKIPATVVMADENRGIRFFGIPSGYEFASLLDAIHMVSLQETELSQETRTFLDNLQTDIHLQVFVTPTCPYCPGAVTLAHRMAHYSPRVKADMLEATEFPHLAQKYNVMGVPRTVINESVFLEGAAPESMLVEKIRSSL
ncbi:MAG: thioredoxin family protein [Candidatus Aminicenantes bacterium]|nr:thioredoxin family protein [Candidatus Aminicenantes bacterium]